MANQRPVIERREQNVYVFYFANEVTVSAAFDQDSITVNRLYRK